MVSLIVRNNVNIFINEETGRLFSFKYDLEDQVIKDINIEHIKKIYSNYIDFIPFMEIIASEEESKSFLPDKMNYLILHVSDLCNMKCKYCYALDNTEDDNSNNMSSQIMIESINKYIGEDDFYVLFHGREPLMNYDNIVKTLEHFKDRKNIKFILQTNGLLLNDSKINQLRKYRVAINISIDGLVDDDNQLRINGMNELNYSQRIKQLIIKYKLSPIIIVHEKNYKSLKDITNYLIKNGIKGASYNFLWPTKENPDLNNYVIDNKDLLEAMKEVFQISISGSKWIFKERDLFLLYGRILKRHINNYMCNSAPCGAGRNCISIYKNGEIYPCTTVNGQKDNYLGNLNDSPKDVLDKKIPIKERDINKIKDCNTCPLRIFCRGGGCAGLIYNYSNNINEKSIYCEYYYEMIIYIISSMLEKSNQKYFMNF